MYDHLLSPQNAIFPPIGRKTVQYYIVIDWNEFKVIPSLLSVETLTNTRGEAEVKRAPKLAIIPSHYTEKTSNLHRAIRCVIMEKTNT